jgi:hypothetical protein
VDVLELESHAALAWASQIRCVDAGIVRANDRSGTALSRWVRKEARSPGGVIPTTPDNRSAADNCLLPAQPVYCPVSKTNDSNRAPDAVARVVVGPVAELQRSRHAEDKVRRQSNLVGDVVIVQDVRRFRGDVVVRLRPRAGHRRSLPRARAATRFVVEIPARLAKDPSTCRPLAASPSSAACNTL